MPTSIDRTTVIPTRVTVVPADPVAPPAHRGRALHRAGRDAADLVRAQDRRGGGPGHRVRLRGCGRCGRGDAGPDGLDRTYRPRRLPGRVRSPVARTALPGGQLPGGSERPGNQGPGLRMAPRPWRPRARTRLGPGRGQLSPGVGVAGSQGPCPAARCCRRTPATGHPRRSQGRRAVSRGSRHDRSCRPLHLRRRAAPRSHEPLPAGGRARGDVQGPRASCRSAVGRCARSPRSGRWQATAAASGARLGAAAAVSRRRARGPRRRSPAPRPPSRPSPAPPRCPPAGVPSEAAPGRR